MFFSIADQYVVAWKRGIAILSAGSVKVTPDPRVRLVNGFSLQIKDAVPQDAGDYVCQIATLEPREIAHTVEILGEFVAQIVQSVTTTEINPCENRAKNYDFFSRSNCNYTQDKERKTKRNRDMTMLMKMIPVFCINLHTLSGSRPFPFRRPHEMEIRVRPREKSTEEWHRDTFA